LQRGALGRQLIGLPPQCGALCAERVRLSLQRGTLGGQRAGLPEERGGLPGQLGGLPAERGRLTPELCRLVDQHDDLPLQRLQLRLLGRQRLLGRGQVRLHGGQRSPGFLARHRLGRRAAGPRDRSRKRPDPDPVSSRPGGERGLRPEVGPDRRLEGDSLAPELHGAPVELALLGQELRLLSLQGRLLGLQRVGLGRQRLLLAFQVGLVRLRLVVLVLVLLAGMRRRAQLGRGQQGAVVPGPVRARQQVEGLPLGGVPGRGADVLLAQMQREHGDDQRGPGAPARPARRPADGR